MALKINHDDNSIQFDKIAEPAADTPAGKVVLYFDVNGNLTLKDESNIAEVVSGNWFTINNGDDFPNAPIGTGARSLSIGNNATSSDITDGIALGTNTVVTANFGIAIGANSDATLLNQTSVGSTITAASVGGGLDLAYDLKLGYGDNTDPTNYNLLHLYDSGKLELYGAEAQFVMPNYITASIPATTIEGGMIYDSTTKTLKYYNNTSWSEIGVSTFTNTDDDTLHAGTNAGNALTTGPDNFLAGAGAGVLIEGGGHNVAIGNNALAAVTGTNDAIGIGRNALQVCNGNNNIAIGGFAGYRMTTTSINNTLIGMFAGQGLYQTGNNENVAIGESALGGTGLVVGAVQNVAIGANALDSITGGDTNVAVGYNAGTTLSTGANNVIVGNAAGGGITTGISNVCIGPGAGGTVNVSNKLYIDNTQTDTPLIGGDFSAGAVDITGTLTISDTLDFTGADTLLIPPNYATVSLPGTPTEGGMVYDTDTKTLKYYNGTSWSGVGVGNMVVDNFEDVTDYTAGTTTALTLSVDPGSENNISVSFDGIVQHHTEYSVAGTTLTFTVAIPLGTLDVEVVIGTTTPIGTPSDNTVSTATLQDGAVTAIKLDETYVTVGTPAEAAKNAIINGNFDIWQRGTSFAAIANGDYSADRFKYSKAGTMVHTITQSTGTVPTYAESGTKSNYSFHLDVTTAQASLGTGNYNLIGYIIEGYDYARIAGGDATLSFWVRGSKTGIHCVSFRNNGADRSYVKEYTINTADTWQKVVITIPLTETGGTWDYITAGGLEITFALAVGSTFHTTKDAWQVGNYLSTSSQVNEVDNVANNFRIAQVQLERGSSATGFEFKSAADELTRCQRYFERRKATAAYTPFFVWQCSSATNIQGPMTYSEKRSAPTITVSGTFLCTNATGIGIATSSFNTVRVSNFAALGQFTTSGMVAGNATQVFDSVSADAAVDFDAEL